MSESIPEQPVFDEAYFRGNFGIGMLEANQVRSHTDASGTTHTVTIGEMLTNPICPVGKHVREGFEENGFEGAREELNQATRAGRRGGYTIEFSEETLTFAALSSQRTVEPPKKN